MGCFRILNNNYIDIDILANNFVSSANTSFPVTNVYNKQRRSKVWRSAGYYNVTSSNNKIIFRETSVGPDLEATIAVAEYVTTLSLCAAIKTALEAAGASTYTVTNSDSTNLKFKIVSDGTGGGNIFSLITTDGDFTSADILGFDTASDLTGSLTYYSDYLRISGGSNGEEWIKWDLGISSLPSSFVLVGSRNRAIKISPSATLKLQGNETDEWSSPSYNQELTYNSESIIMLSSTTLNETALRYWRLLIEDQNPLGYVEIGALFLGTYYAPDRGRVQFPYNSNLIDRTEIQISEGGQEYSDVREKTQEFSVVWSALTKTEIEMFEEIFDVYGTGVPFFVSMDSDAVFSSSANKRVRFVKFATEPTFTLTSPNFFQMTMSFREQL